MPVPSGTAERSLLFASLTVRGVTLPNRVGVSPMCTYAATAGFVSDYHLVHLGRFALGGAGLVIVECTAVVPEGRISHHDVGLWGDEHVAGLARIASFLAARGAVPGIQLSHAGRRASVTEPWFGGLPLPDERSPGEPWTVVAPSPIAAGPGWPTPTELDEDSIGELVERWAQAAARAVAAGFRVIELHGAHGYLLHSFLSPLANARTDRFGGSARARMRFPLEVIAAVRAAIPDDVALFYRVSSVDGVEGGLSVADVAEFARQAVAAGVDVIDTSSGGIITDRSVETRIRRGFAFHADFSREFKREIPVVATVGLIVDPEQAKGLIAAGDADIVLLGREMLEDPNWTLHARRALAADEFAHWHVEAGSAIEARRRTLENLARAGETPLDRFAGVER